MADNDCSNSEQDVESNTNAQSLPPIDGGRGAWLVLTATFVLGAIVWGFPYSFGVFQEYYLRQDRFSGYPSGVAAIGTTATGVMYLTAPFVFAAVQRYRNRRKMIVASGFLVMLVSLIGASFADTVAQLVVTQGVLYGIGGSLLNFPVFNYVDEWFYKRRGLAYGAIVAGDGAGGVVIPFAMEWVLNRWGFRTALRAWTIVCLLLVTPSVFFLKDYPVDQDIGHGLRNIDLRFMRTRVFWILQSGNMLQGLGYFIPSYYLPSFAVARGWSPLVGTIAVSLSNAAIVFGGTTVGWLCDRYHFSILLIICTIGTVFSVFVLWGFSVYQPVMYIFAVAYGFFAGGFAATWAGCGHAIRRVSPVETGMIVALFTAGRGVGSIMSGPLGGVLASSDTWKDNVGFAYGSGFGYLIVFSGITATFGSLGFIGKRFGWVT